MLRNIALCVALVLAGPAFGQVIHLDGGIPQMNTGSASAERSVAYADCERRFASLQARSQMEPSKRRHAIETCRAIAEARILEEQLAKLER